MMEKKIIGIIKPFVMQQEFYVYENGNKLAATSCKMKNIYETIFSLADENNVTQVSLAGPKQYTKGLIKKIKQKELDKYNENKLIIDTI